jgi:predicted transcriptional regulator of viral defense system
MVGSEKPPEAPDWDSLFGVAQSQAGYFTTKQAARAGYSSQLLAYYRGTKVERVQRGIHRLVHFPASDSEDLVVFWLWSDQEGVFSHETALALHDLSDVLPSKVHLTLPTTWRQRRLRVPSGLVLHFAEVGDPDRGSFDAVPVTVPLRTLRDCIDADVAPRFVNQAIRQARRRGLISSEEEARLRDALRDKSEAVER